MGEADDIQRALEANRAILQLTPEDEERLSKHIWYNARLGKFPLEWVVLAVESVTGEVLARRVGGDKVKKTDVARLLVRWCSKPFPPRTRSDAEETVRRHVAQKDWHKEQEQWAEGAVPFDGGER